MKPLSNYLIIFLFISIFSNPAEAYFINNNNGTVTDTKTLLMWATKDNGIPISWYKSLEYCKNFKVGGFTDWRLPTLDELSSIYDPENINKRGYYTIKFIETTASSCWASDIRNSDAGRFNFTHGKIFWLRKSYNGPTRVIPVRDFKN